jgi:hypothetical protein
VTDRLLMTRREQLRESGFKLVACALPTTVLVAILFALGGKPAAVATLIFGELAALALATSVRTVRAAAIGGVLLAAGLVGMLLFFAYVRGA